jgi:glyoxylase-like metal-dependent hydrolase (beta-lactamase superfamily II)
MHTLASGLAYFDLNFMGVPRVIAAAVLHGAGGAAIVDPGPTTTLPALRRALADAGIAIDDVTALLLTHIHLDHGGCAGTLVHEHPRLRVFVHEKGAPHLAAPEKLVASAARLYGDAMDKLWGEVRPVPPEALVVLKGGERIDAAGHALDVAYTPGHASHHVSFLARGAGIAFVGDAAGLRIPPTDLVLPATPPPDIDLDAWREGLARISAWRPETLFLAHFGPSSPVRPHLSELVERLEAASQLVRESLARDEPDQAREAWFAAEFRRDVQRQIGEADAQVYEVAERFDLNWRGLARYWRKRS